MPIRALLIGSLFCIVFSYVSIVALNRSDLILPSTQISSLSILFCLALVFGLNPLLGLLRRKLLSNRELILIFIMATVPAGLPAYGYVSQVVPMISSLHNADWNTAQSQWDEIITPDLRPELFMGAPLFAERDVRDWRAFHGQLVAASTAAKPSPARRLWNALGEDTHRQIRLAAKGEDFTESERQTALRTTRTQKETPEEREQALAGWEATLATDRLRRQERYRIVHGISRVLARPDFYDKDSFADVALPQAAQTLLSQKTALAPAQVKRLNRMLLEAAFPDDIRSSRFLRDQQAMHDLRWGLRARDREAWPVFLKKPDESFAAFGARFGAYFASPEGASAGARQARFFGAVPWSNWAGPLAHWLCMGLIFCLLFYTLNELVFRQWYEREQVAFPIAQLGSMLLESDADEGGSCIPAIFRCPHFWVGFAIAFGVYFYNAVAKANWVPGLTPLPLQTQIRFRHLSGTWLEGLIPMHFEIFFTVIGLAFLLPTHISFSIWFFFVLMKVQQLIAVYLGYGVDGYSFRADWHTTSHFMTAQGGGALVVFGFVYLWKVRQQLLAFLYWMVRPKSTDATYENEIRPHTLASFLFFCASAGVIGMLRWGGVSWAMAVLVYVFLVFLTVALARLVAECGLVSFQIFFGPLHLIKIFGLLRFPALFAAKGLGMVVMVLKGFFLDMKVFIAPTMLNGKWLAARQRISTRTFVVSLILCIGITLVVASTVAIIMATDLGAGVMHSGFFKLFPQWSFDHAKKMLESPEELAHLDGSLAGWFALGAILCCGLLYLRSLVFWVPHPIGLVMFSDNLAKFFWFSFLIAWICKRAAIRYCDPEQHKAVRSFFVGLIVGAVMAVGLAVLLCLTVDPNMRLCLDPHRR